MGKKLGKIGIGRLVIDDEAGIDGYGAATIQIDVDSAAVPARPRVAFEQRNVMASSEHPGRPEAGNATPNHGDA